MSSSRYVPRTSFNKDKFIANNVINEHNLNTTLPNTSEKNQVQSNQFVNGTLNLFFNKLLDNDKIISNYIDQIAFKIDRPEQKISANFEQQDDNYNLTTITQKYAKLSAEHISTYHTENSSIKYLNKNVATNNCENLELSLEDQKLTVVKQNTVSSSIFEVENDEVVNFEFEDDNTEQTFVIAHVYNKATNYQKAFYIVDERVQGIIPSIIKVPYILKTWISGIKELYIYLGTTFTFYNSEPDIDNPTIIELSLHKNHFNINKIIDLNITGQSFPIKVDMTDTNGEYRDKILPSVVTDVKSEIEDEEYYHLFFACYGTDAQAIAIKYI